MNLSLLSFVLYGLTQEVNESVDQSFENIIYRNMGTHLLQIIA